MELKERKILKKEKFQPKIEKSGGADLNVFEFINKTLTDGKNNFNLRIKIPLT